MFNKKLLMVLSITAISSTLLTGCFSGERGKILDQAQQEYANGNYEAAKESFEKAMRMQSFSEKESNLDSAYKETLNKLWSSYYKNGDEKLETKEFKGALESYNKAYAIYSGDADLEQAIKTTKSLLAEQNRLNDYLEFVSPLISDSNELLRSLNKDIDETVVGSLSVAAFQSHVKSIVPKSNSIVSKLDDSFTAVDGDIADIHQKFISLIQYQHQTFTAALNASTSEDFAMLSDRYISIKQQQTDLIETIQNYANNKGIGYKLVREGSESENKQNQNDKTNNSTSLNTTTETVKDN